MSDPIYSGFLREQYRQGMDLAAHSDLLSLSPMEPGTAPRYYVAKFFCQCFPVFARTIYSQQRQEIHN